MTIPAIMTNVLITLPLQRAQKNLHLTVMLLLNLLFSYFCLSGKSAYVKRN